MSENMCHFHCAFKHNLCLILSQTWNLILYYNCALWFMNSKSSSIICHIHSMNPSKWKYCAFWWEAQRFPSPSPWEWLVLIQLKTSRGINSLLSRSADSQVKFSFAACPKGRYKSGYSPEPCQPCPPTSTTESEGSTSAEDCELLPGNKSLIYIE